MWIFTSDTFVSVVQHRDPSAAHVLIVRGRFAGDAARFLGLPLSAEEETPSADYRFRCYAHRDEVAAAAARAALAVDYGNFKSSMTVPWRKRVAMRLWSVLWGAQTERHGKPPPVGQMPLSLALSELEPHDPRPEPPRLELDVPVPDYEPRRRPSNEYASYGAAWAKHDTEFGPAR